MVNIPPDVSKVSFHENLFEKRLTWGLYEGLHATPMQATFPRGLHTTSMHVPFLRGMHAIPVQTPFLSCLLLTNTSIGVKVLWEKSQVFS